MEDEKIIELFFQRSEAALDQVKQKYSNFCASVARRIVSDPRDVEECLNDTWLNTWESIPPTRPKSLQAYLAKVTRNLALDRFDYQRAEKRDAILTVAFEELEPWLPGGRGSMEEQVAFSDFLNRFLRSLTEDNRAVFIRRYWYGESIQELACAMRRSEARVKSSLFRTRKKLAEEMQKAGVTL